MKRPWIPLLGGWLLLAVPMMAEGPVNVVQDCWTDETDDPTLELEDYRFASNDRVVFVWKQKLMKTCSNYVASIYGFQCINGKPAPSALKFSFLNLQYGQLAPDPTNPEVLLNFTTAPGAIAPGQYDWILVSECNDTNGVIAPDGDVDDQCGINVGVPPVFNGPVIYGPEPVEILDPSPPGMPAGRVAGEEGTTRPWCFQVLNIGIADPKEVEPHEL